MSTLLVLAAAVVALLSGVPALFRRPRAKGHNSDMKHHANDKI